MTKLPTKTLALLIEQLTMERHANAAYSAIAASLSTTPFLGFATWLYAQGKEELDHAERVFNYIKSRGIHGATIDECANDLHIRTASVCGRFSELQGKDYGEDGAAKRWPKRIEKSDEKRKSSSGFSCQVWVALP